MKPSIVFENLGVLLHGFWLTVELTVAAIITATLLGFLVALIRYLRVPVLRQICAVYLDLFRGSPLIVQILFVYFGSQ